MIVAGFGFRQGASASSLRDAYDHARTGLAAGGLATAEDKAAAPAFRALAETLGLPIRGIPASQLCTQATLTRSPRVLDERATGSVAEA
ncbi:cobalamin biosynthesis protein, partial [Yangia mangrovi]